MNVYNEAIIVLGKFDLDKHNRLLAKDNNRFLVEDENFQFSFTYDLFAEKQFFSYTFEKLFYIYKNNKRYDSIFIDSVVSI